MIKTNIKNLKPLILFSSRAVDKKIIHRLKNNPKVQIVDEFAIFTSELNEILDLKFKNRKIGNIKSVNDIWIYYPWRFSLVHLVDKFLFRQLRLSRNNNLITIAQQKKFLNYKVGIVGMNVGYHAAICLALEGGAEKMKFADPDILTPTSFNRFRASLVELGKNKTILSAQQVYEIDPFYSLELYTKGITHKNIDKFLNKPKINLLIEEMDNLPLKIFIREKAKQYHIPVIMVTGNAENLILDIERYDMKKQPKLLNGYLSKKIIDKISRISLLTKPEKVKLAKDFIGNKYLHKRLLQSFAEVGKTIPGIPQIAETSFLRGLVLTQVTRRMANNEYIPSGRYKIKIDNIF